MKPMILLVFTLILSRVTEALQVVGGNMTVVQGGDTVLPCKLRDTTEPLSVISWRRQTRGKPQNDNFLTIQASNVLQFVKERDGRFQFIGDINDKNGSLLFSNITLMDEGTYTCIYTLFPSGLHQTKIPLNLLVPPVTSLQDDRPALGDEEVSLVTCTAAGSRPPAKLKWVTGYDTPETVRATTYVTLHANGTTTTVSSLFGVPTKKIHHHLIQCVVTSAAMSTEETLACDIQVYFSPMDVNIRERSEGMFECMTEANPHANFNWSRIGQSWPQAVKVKGATLQFPTMTSDLNGIYQCEASNPYGRKSTRLYIHVTSGACTACWVIFRVLLVLVLAVAAAAAWCLKSKRFETTRYRSPLHMRKDACGEGKMVKTTCNLNARDCGASKQLLQQQTATPNLQEGALL